MRAYLLPAEVKARMQTFAHAINDLTPGKLALVLVLMRAYSAPVAEVAPQQVASGEYISVRVLGREGRR